MQGPVLGEVAADPADVRVKEGVAEAIRSDPGGLPLRLLHGQRFEGLEKSFKMSAGALLANRYLLGIHKSEITPARLFDLCARMGMPERHLPGFRENAQGANAFHIGFEGKAKGGIYKAYLEFAQRLVPGRTEQVLLHLAYKWDCLDPDSCTIARYECHPGLSTQSILERLAGAGDGQEDSCALGVAREVLRLAADRAAGPIMYLEVSEDNNPRASFDLNLHEADIRIGEVGALLVQARDRYAIPAGEFDSLYGRVSAHRLGHLAGGISREGSDFLTLYYPVERV